MDFGLARPEQEAARLTSDGVIVGTPAYMAPEQAAGQPERTGPWTDLYSVGIVFFEMLTGRLPFEGTPMAVLGKIVHEPPPALSRLRPYLDARLDAILLKALRKEPEARFQSARQFSEALAGLAVAVPTAPMAAQRENQATPNHSLSEPHPNGITRAQMVKASGVIVRVEPADFVAILKRQPGALVVHATGGFFGTEYRYLTSYKGLAFYTKAREPLDLPPGTELVQAKAIWVPGGG
jgi:serine/threonine protein kinase